jgi:phosphate transport system substrate-binding protein
MRLPSKIFASVSTGIAAIAIATVAFAADITGAGATFPFPVYAKWAAAYKGVSGNGLNYQSIGSGGGIQQIEKKTVTFGASDMPLPVEELNKFGLVQFPTVIGGVVPVVNIRGVGAGALVLDGPTLAAIYQGKVTKWNDPAIKKLNASLTLPDQAITVVHRSDGSGTTFIFTNYLSKVSPDWDKAVHFATAVEWPAGVGAKGNEGVAGNTAQTAGAIGFVEYAYAKQNNLAYVKMINKDGKTVSPVAANFAASAAGATWGPADGFGTVLTDQPGAATWPISGATFIVVYKQPQDQAATKEALKFFQWSFQNGDKMAADLDYVSFPGEVKQKIMATWSQVQGWNGGK